MLGILVVAEGVETEREANFLLSVQCRIVQGYLYGRPMSLDAFEALLEVSPLGDKMKALLKKPEKYTEIPYWEIEEFHLLLRHSGMILFNYEPSESGEKIRISLLKSDGIQKYTKNLPPYFKIHPDYEQVLEEALNCMEQETVTAEFQADDSGTGGYQWYRVTLYHYKSNGKQNRVIGVIEKDICDK